MLKTFCIFAAVACVSFWSGFLTAALVCVSKEGGTKDGGQDDSSTESSKGAADEAEGSWDSD